MDTITSSNNPRVKLVRLLQSQNKARRKHHLLVLEGVRLVEDAAASGIRPDFVFFAESAERGNPIRDLALDLEAMGANIAPVTESLMQDMSDTETPQGILAVFPWPNLPVPDAPDLVVVADGWRDPGNLGTLIRTAAAAGVDLIAMTPGTVDPTNPKVIRAGMGAHFRLPVIAHDWDALAARLAGLQVCVADSGGETSYLAVDWAQPSALVIGGEAHGPRAVIRDLPHTRVHIPMQPGAESLNAAVAASILIYAARAHTWA